MWTCENCDYELSVDEFEDDYVFWFCDECGAYLNDQDGFDRNASKHICQNCGYENDTTLDNIKGICSDCGKVIADPEATLCEDCRQARKDKAKENLKTIGKVAGVVAAAVGTAYLASKYTDESNDDEAISYIPTGDSDDDDGEESEEMNCPQCGRKMKGDWPDKTRYFNCESCGDRFFVEDDGEIVNVLYRGNKNSKKCANCGQSLRGGSYTAPWENGNNSDGYIKCPHCGYVNFEWDD